MDKLISWVGVDLSNRQCIVFAVKAFFLAAMTTAIGALICKLLAIEAMRETTQDFIFSTEAAIIYTTVVIWVPIEELIFRLLPAMAFLYLARKQDQHSRIVGLLVVLLITSITFGLAHGSVAGIIVHTPFGLVCAAVFMRCGGCVNRLFRGFVYCSAVHVTYTLIAVALQRTAV